MNELKSGWREGPNKRGVFLPKWESIKGPEIDYRQIKYQQEKVNY